MLAAAHAAEHLLIGADGKEARVQRPFVEFSRSNLREEERHDAAAGRVDVVPVTGDAAEADAPEGTVEVVERQADEVLAQRPGVRERRHDGAVDEVPGRSGPVRLDRDDPEQVRRVLGHGVAPELADQRRRSRAVAGTDVKRLP